jgi:hypothetical protein
MSILAYALTTRARVMQFMNVSSLSATEETVLDNMINSVTDFVESYCGRRFKKTTYTSEIHSGEGQDTLILKNYPVISTETTTFYYRNSTDNEDSWTTVDSSDYFIDHDNGMLILAGEAELGKLRRFYKVSYTAGYDFDNTTTFLSTVGLADLEYVTWRLVTTLFDKRKGDAGVQSESIGDYSVTYTTTIFESPEISEVLNKYKRTDLAVFGISSKKDY